MNKVEGYQHRVGVHCETGSLRNLLSHAGLEVSEAMIFGVGSGPAFYYLFFAKGPSTFPLVGIRNAPGSVWSNISRRCGVEVFLEQLRDQDEAIREANLLLDVGRPVACCVDMFYMKYLPLFMQVHAPAHFIVLMGRDPGGRRYLVSDPYHAEPGVLDEETLRAAWAPGAVFSRDNLLAWVKHVPDTIDWESAALTAMKATCRSMLPPPGVGKALFFVGIAGMKTYARAIERWGDRFRGVALREGILFNAVAFEDQGTGGGAFRIMYGAFLEEAGELLGSKALVELGEAMAAHGQAWRRFSRKLAVVGKKVPKDEEAYDDWYEAHSEELHHGLREAADSFRERIAFEERFYSDLQRVVSDIERRRPARPRGWRRLVNALGAHS